MNFSYWLRLGVATAAAVLFLSLASEVEVDTWWRSLLVWAIIWCCVLAVTLAAMSYKTTPSEDPKDDDDG